MHREEQTKQKRQCRQLSGKKTKHKGTRKRMMCDTATADTNTTKDWMYRNRNAYENHT